MTYFIQHVSFKQVFFVCAKTNQILNVSEPTTCNYHMNFSTPYVCHKQAMLVYPTLSQELQTEWNLLEGELARKEITPKVKKIVYFEKKAYTST